MKFYQGVLFATLMLGSIQSWSQDTPIDSLQPYTMPLWRAWRVISDLQRKDRLEILIDSASSVIQAKNKALELADKTIVAQDSAFTAKASECQECRLYVNKSEALQKVELKRASKKGNKKMVFGFVSGVLLVLLL